MKHREEYLTYGGVFCPFCKSPDIEGGSVDIAGSEAFQELSCVSCGGAWRDRYELVAVQALENSAG
jgi:hypothetical protein